MVKKRLLKNFNVSNKLSYTIIAVVALLLVGSGVYSLSPGVAPNPGHTFDQIDPPSGCTLGQVLQWTGSAWSCVNSQFISLKRVFVTSTTYDGNLGGISGANSKCQVRADVAGLGGTWKAIISSSSQNAKDIVGTSWTELINVNGETVSQRYFNPTTGLNTPFTTYDGTNYLIAPLNMNELGVVYSSGTTVYAWTGSSASGTNSDNCNDWTSTVASGKFGLITTITTETSITGSPTWITTTLSSICGSSGSGTRRLYCIES